MGLAATQARLYAEIARTLNGLDVEEKRCEADYHRAVEDGLCSKCASRDLVGILKDTRHLFQGDRWTLAELTEAAISCRFCFFLLTILRNDSEHYKIDLDSQDKIVLRVEAIGRRGTHPKSSRFQRLALWRWRVKETINGNERGENIKVSCIMPHVPSSHKSNGVALFHGRQVLPEVDLRLLSSWFKNCCGSDHHNACQPNNWPAELDIRFRLINIKLRCIVEAPQNCKYVALSYVWGNAKHLTLGTDTFRRLTSSSGLSDELEDIPRSFRDAMRLVGCLGLEYLWIDALCIKQDDADDVNSHLRAMDSIYSCAALTIVAATDSADTGLPGMHLFSRLKSQNVYRSGGIMLINARPTFSEALRKSAWESRAWTMQEKYFSKRLLIFADSQVFYHCRVATWFEDTIMEYHKPAEISLNEEIWPEDHIADKSALSRFKGLLAAYFTRKLSYDRDALRAFSGILNSISSELGSDIWGIPSAIFTEAILWMYNGHNPDRRRADFPSWSWAGWQAGNTVHIRFETNKVQTDTDIEWRRYRFDNLRGWCLIDIPSELGRTPQIIQTAVVLEDLPLSSDDALDSGHNDYSQAISSRGKILSPLSHILHLRTHSAFLSIDDEPSKLEPVATPIPAEYWTVGENCEFYAVRVPRTGKRIGTIILSRQWRASRSKQGEFILIGRGAGSFRVTEEPIKGCLAHVMLIEWVHGIAYRVQICAEPLRLEEWLEAEPQRKLILLA